LLPSGEGLFAVKSVEEAAAAIRAIRADYGKHSAAARRVAERYLNSDIVLPRMLREAGIGGL
jgi:hypothetical protein